MKPTPLLFAGIFASFAAAWYGLIVAADCQIGNLQPQVDPENDTVYPINAAGVVEQGRRVYLGNGCNQCHTQFVRNAEAGPDIKRGWGTRQSVALDYLYSSGAEIGVARIGPDLSAAGVQPPEGSGLPPRDAQWFYNHLYNPRALNPQSIMPSYAFLFKKQKIQGQRSADAVDLVDGQTVEEGYEIIPTPEAKALVGYLLSLDRSTFPILSPGSKPAEAAAK